MSTEIDNTAPENSTPTPAVNPLQAKRDAKASLKRGIEKLLLEYTIATGSIVSSMDIDDIGYPEIDEDLPLYVMDAPKVEYLRILSAH